MTEADEAPGPQPSNAIPHACLQCRKVKMKCHKMAQDTRCVRCTRKSLQCDFLGHRRGRKHGFKLRKAGARGQENVATTSENIEAVTRPPAISNRGSASQHINRDIVEDGDVDAFTDDDPISKGLVNLHFATELFGGFMKHLNPFISQLDPSLHTFQYVREASSFLFTSVLAASAKLLHPALQKPLLSHAEELFVQSFRCGSKSPETVQAILILTYWKEPRDNRAWLSVGHAIRMAIELGWHQLGGDGMRPPENGSDRQAMEFRNIERTWLVLFVYDRSISLQTGKPWMIERSSYLESVSNWHLHPLEVANDRLLCAFVSLRLITSTHFEMMTTQYAQHQRQEPSQFRSLLRDCHTFLIPFYGSYARLLLFTSSLRASIRLKDIETSVDTEAIWNSYSSALDMLKLVSDPSSSQLVYFAQDSVHVMIAYATVFLIKILLSAPSYIRVEMEVPALDAIRNTAEVFDKLQAPVGTSCALQAAFLHNVLIQHEAMRAQRLSSRSQIPATPAALTGPTTAVDTAVYQSASRHAQEAQETDVNSAYKDQNMYHYASEDASTFDMNFVDDEAWAFMFANAGFNIGQGAFMSPI
ncbi:hypothetical protein ACET3X_004567 [Alternaria dauci]|uniref:Zn(2)-C6 fungal-type domain-containing protein n=1 Tax=Alternaria dauci TaxID=48095 RepID=A0ABR3UR66_9PLEO